MSLPDNVLIAEAKARKQNGDALINDQDPTAALIEYEAAIELLDGPALKHLTDLDADRARLTMNRGACLHDLGRSQEALDAYDATAGLLAGPPPRQQSGPRFA